MEDTTKLIFLLLLVFPFSSEATHDGEVVRSIVFVVSQPVYSVFISKIQFSYHAHKLLAWYLDGEYIYIGLLI